VTEASLGTALEWINGVLDAQGEGGCLVDPDAAPGAVACELATALQRVLRRGPGRAASDASADLIARLRNDLAGKEREAERLQAALAALERRGAGREAAARQAEGERRGELERAQRRARELERRCQDLQHKNDRLAVEIRRRDLERERLHDWALGVAQENDRWRAGGPGAGAAGQAPRDASNRARQPGAAPARDAAGKPRGTVSRAAHGAVVDAHASKVAELEARAAALEAALEAAREEGAARLRERAGEVADLQRRLTVAQMRLEERLPGGGLCALGTPSSLGEASPTAGVDCEMR